MKFRFVGKNDFMNLKKGQVYEIKTLIKHNLIWVIWDDNSCTYKDLKSFLSNWKEVNE